MEVFVSYTFDSDLEKIAKEIVSIIKKKTSYKAFFWTDAAAPGLFRKILQKEIRNCDYVVLFWGNRVGDTQIQEIGYALEMGKTIIPVKSPGHEKPVNLDSRHAILSKLEQYAAIHLKRNFRRNLATEAQRATDDLIEKLRYGFDEIKGLPKDYPFQYEKDIIRAYLEGNGQLPEKLVRQGCPRKWPHVKKKNGDIQNPISEERVGKYRDWDHKKRKVKNTQVVSAALSDYHLMNHKNCLLRLNLSFPEAGPRKFIYYPDSRIRLRVGIVVSGGIAPGINSVISGIVKRHVLYHRHNASHAGRKNQELKIYGFLEGFRSMLSTYDGPRTKILFDSTKPEESTDSWLKAKIYDNSAEGGSIIPTSRTPDLLEEDGENFKDITKFLKIKHMDIVYVIGGDGSMKAAHVLSNYALRENLDISIIGIPKTMDNDILWVWQSFGFASSIEWAKGAIRQINTEVASNPRLCIVQLFGSDSGFVATHTALASGVCDLVLVPEVGFKLEIVVNYIIKKLEDRYTAGENGRSPYGVVLLAETALPTDALSPRILNNSGLTKKEKEEIKKYFDNGRRLKGQTSDELRSAGLKILSSAVQKALKGKYWKQFRVLTIEPKQLIRSVPPSTLDIILGERLGSLAVDGAMAGYHDFMISQWLTEYVMIPLDLVVLGRKRIPNHGFLWKSVIATTGQPYDLAQEP
jgi:6-phosphofructokinase 1